METVAKIRFYEQDLIRRHFGSIDDDNDSDVNNDHDDDDNEDDSSASVNIYSGHRITSTECTSTDLVTHKLILN